MTKFRPFKEIFSKFVFDPKLNGTYADPFYKGLRFFEPLESSNPHEFISSFLISKEYTNFLGNMHGGAMATLLDCTTTLVILKADRNMRKTVSVDFGLSFLNPANINDNLIIKSECTKLGKSLAYSDAKVFVGSKLIISFRHVKAFLKESYFDEEFIKKING